MFWRKKRQVPWDEVGTTLGERIVVDSQKLSNKIKEALQGENEPGLPNFSDPRWMYELCQWKMFWVLYFANLPQLRESGVTKPWLDAYHKSAYLAMARAGLLKSRQIEDVRAWEKDSDTRFVVYKRAFENPPPEPMLFTATLGWEFARFLFPSEEPNFKLVMLMNEAGSAEFQALDKMVDSLEKSYGHY